jgi:hypothetical protein
MSERAVTYHQYRQQAVDLVVQSIHTTDMGPPGPEGGPGVNDPTGRVGAFCYGAELACRPLIAAYVADEPKDLQAVFDSTFRLSFHFSAGVPLIQSMYQARIARLLREKYGEEHVTRAAEDAVFNPASARPPSNHVQGRAMHRAESRAPAIWQFYIDILKAQDNLGDLQPRDRMTQKEIGILESFGNKEMFPLGLPYFLLVRECVYLEEGRPSKTDDNRKYRSDIIDYSLSEKSIGNPEFDVIFSEMGIVLGALRKLQLEELPDFYLITDTKNRLTQLEDLAASR